MISVIIPTRNEEKNLPKALESLNNQTYSKKFEIVVVDGKSTDNTREIAKKHGCKVFVQKKLGISNARNLGWKRAKGDILIFLEADVRVDKNLLKEIDKIFKSHDVMCAGATYEPEQKNWIQKALGVQIRLSIGRHEPWMFPLAYRKEVFEKMGGWDESIDFAEDREFPMRLKKFGYKVVPIKKRIGYSRPVNSLRKLFKEGRWYGRNILGYFKKTRDWITLLGVFIYSSFIPFLILSVFNYIFLILFILDFLALFAYSLQGFFTTKSPYAFLMIPINIIRGFGEFIGIIESPFKKSKGKI